MSQKHLAGYNISVQKKRGKGRHLELRPPNSDVFFQDVMIPRHNVKKYTKRNKELVSQQCEIPQLPDGIRIESPVNSSSGDQVAESWLEVHLRRDELGASEPSSQVTVTNRPSQPSILSRRAPLSMDAIAKMLISPSSSDIPAASLQYSLPILDPGFAMCLAPLLDNISIIRFQSAFRGFLESNPLPGDNPAWFTDCFKSFRELERRDAFDLGLCPTGAGAFDINPISEYPNSPDAQLSRFDDLFNILSFILHQLSNLTPRDDTSILRAMFVVMEALSDKSLGFESLFKILVGLDCQTVRAASYGPLTWGKVNDDENLLRIFAETVLQQHSAAWFYQSQRLHGPLLVLAARFGFSTIWEELIKNGVSPNQTGEFLDNYRDDHLDYQPNALAEAAKMGNVDTVKILLDCGADVNFASRDYGLIAAVKLLFELKHNSI